MARHNGSTVRTSRAPQSSKRARILSDSLSASLSRPDYVGTLRVPEPPPVAQISAQHVSAAL